MDMKLIDHLIDIDFAVSVMSFWIPPSLLSWYEKETWVAVTVLIL